VEIGLSCQNERRGGELNESGSVFEWGLPVVLQWKRWMKCFSFLFRFLLVFTFLSWISLLRSFVFLLSFLASGGCGTCCQSGVMRMDMSNEEGQGQRIANSIIVFIPLNSVVFIGFMSSCVGRERGKSSTE